LKHRTILMFGASGSGQGTYGKIPVAISSLVHGSCGDAFRHIARIQRRALKDNRRDDANLAVMRGRLKTCKRETMPMLNFYGGDIVHRLNTDGTPTQAFAKILRHVGKLGAS
jgi:adenylate kinase